MSLIVSHQTGSIEVICGSMFSGKTEELIRRLRRAKIAKQKRLSSNRALMIATAANTSSPTTK